MFVRRQDSPVRGDGRSITDKGRQEADALFKSKRPRGEPAVQNPVTRPDHSVRKPRILKTLSTSVRREEHGVVVIPEQRTTPEIPKSQFARIRAWVKYGMTATQVAGIYGVGVDAIRRILSQV